MVRPSAKWNYSGIRVRDLDRSIRFYEKIGFRVKARGTMDHGGEIVDLAFPRHSHWLELNYYPPSNRFYEPFQSGTEFDHFGFTVEDIAGWATALRRWRLPVVADFIDRNSRLIYTRDPDGNWVELCGRVRRARVPRRHRE
jgi:catechol 2,3-dioxygenase-like lactoylglutathione lyase family enzyme